MTISLLKSALGRLRIVAIIEGWSYLMLGITMILKYRYALPEPNYIVGMIHGLFFIVYIGLVVQVSYQMKWSLTKVFKSCLASIIPLGTFYAEKHWFRDVQGPKSKV